MICIDCAISMLFLAAVDSSVVVYMKNAKKSRGMRIRLPPRWIIELSALYKRV